MSGRPLDGKVALVTGASKGIGRGIALELGACGATVYVTARTMDGPDGLLLTVEQIEGLGGKAVALQCDHGDDAQVERVFTEIEQRDGPLDLLVNNASPDFSAMVGVPFWDIDPAEMDACLRLGPRSNFVATSLAAKQMIGRGSGLIVNISSHGAEDYVLSVPYGAGKAAIDKITNDTALWLREHGIAVISLCPGLVLTERIVAFSTVNDDGVRELAGLDLAIGESPRFSGRAVVALATDPDVMTRTGGSFFCSRLAREYGFTEDDGHLPPEVRNLAGYLGSFDAMPDYWRLVEPFWPAQAHPQTATQT
jgi:NAD(P)-dependent dehydrogenase (short-subunit alcohol dehydrogenase family)